MVGSSQNCLSIGALVFLFAPLICSHDKDWRRTRTVCIAGIVITGVLIEIPVILVASSGEFFHVFQFISCGQSMVGLATVWCMLFRKPHYQSKITANFLGWVSCVAILYVWVGVLGWDGVNNSRLPKALVNNRGFNYNALFHTMFLGVITFLLPLLQAWVCSSWPEEETPRIPRSPHLSGSDTLPVVRHVTTGKLGAHHSEHVNYNTVV